MKFRQIHLDFHTSELIPGIGSGFDAKVFGESFRQANVDSVNIFAKCHHGLSYHPTNVGKMHPGLEFDLLRAQIDALHAQGIKAPIYVSAGWDEHAMRQHPEWRVVSPEGVQLKTTTPDKPGWAFVDFASPYLDYLCRQIDEVMNRYPDGDGVWIDICFQIPSVSEYAKRGMTAEGLDWTNPADVNRFAGLSVERLFDEISTVVGRNNPKTPIFFNSGHIRQGLRQHYLQHYSHLELESLPTTYWGYEHFPLSARYVEQLGFDYLGMTGKFHWSWGELGGYKTAEALTYECGAMLAQGAHCCIGDHLHPTGEIDQSTMRAIGAAYAHVQAREDWCVDTINRAEIGVLPVAVSDREGLTNRPTRGHIPDESTVRVLLESGYTFDVLDFESDFSKYRLLILPDAFVIDPELAVRLDDYVASGGRVLLTGRSGIGEDGFVVDVGAKWEGTSSFLDGDYVLPAEGLRAAEIDNPLFMYVPSERVTPTVGHPMGQVYDPYFDRTLRHFSGHLNTPNRPEPSGYCAAVENGGYLYVAHPLFTAYHKVGSVAMLNMAKAYIARALGHAPMIQTSLPKAGRASLRMAEGRNSDVLHLLFATPVLRGTLGEKPLQVIQDIVELQNIEVSLECRGKASGVVSVPDGASIPFDAEQDRVKFVVPRLLGHQMIEIRYA